MNKTQDDILRNFDSLIKAAEETLQTCETSLTGEPKPRDDDYFSFRTQALNLIRRVCGDTSNHYDALKRIASENESANDSSFFPHCLGVVRAAKKDFELGLLFDLRAVIAAELLGSFMDQAERSLNATHICAAASLAGAVLEELLGKIAEAHKISPPSFPPEGGDDVSTSDRTSMKSLNDELAAGGVYNALVQKRIASLAELRAIADQGQIDALKSEDVEDMIRWLQKFAADHLT